MHKLTVADVKAAKTPGAPRKLVDEGGLYSLLSARGSKYWSYDYRFAGKRKTLALGVFPEVSLAEARKSHFRARESLREGADSGETKKIQKKNRGIAESDTFESVAREWFEQKMSDKSDSYRSRTWRILRKDLFPTLGKQNIARITPPEALSALKSIEDRKVDIAHRAKQVMGLIFRFAIATGKASNDPTRDLSEALKPRRKKHHAAITDPKEAAKLLIAIDRFEGTIVVKSALSLSALLFQRPGEIRHMEWQEINWEQNRWELPGAKMKMGLDHIVPLSAQARQLLVAIHAHTGRGKYVFPSARGASRPLSENGVRTALLTMGFDKHTMTPHGFRAMARTLLDEQLRCRVELIEHQLAHAVRDATGRAYNRTAHLDERVKMMQSWADYLSELKG